MVLKSFFDAGNKADSSQYDVVSLAVVSGTKDEWQPFDKQWRGVLRKHRAEFLHTTDAVSRKGIYEGWTEAQRDHFLKDCVDIAAQSCARAKIDDVPGRFGIYCFVVTFVLKDFIEVAKTIPGSPNNANESCLRQALGEILPWATEQAACDECHLFFDQGEPFYGHLCHLLQNKKALRDAHLLQKITQQSECDMRLMPALQLADLYAWSVSHKLGSWQPKWQTKLLKTHYRWQWMDQKNLRHVDIAGQERFLSWKLPKRAATK
jgi:hypothetical protein